MASFSRVPTLDQCVAYDDPLPPFFTVIFVSFSDYSTTMPRNVRVRMGMYHTGQLVSNDDNVRVKFEVRNNLCREARTEIRMFRVDKTYGLGKLKTEGQLERNLVRGIGDLDS